MIRILNNMNYKESNINQIAGYTPLVKMNNRSLGICAICTNGLIIPGEHKDLDITSIIILTSEKLAMDYLRRLKQSYDSKFSVLMNLYMGTVYTDSRYTEFTVRYDDSKIFTDDESIHDIWRNE